MKKVSFFFLPCFLAVSHACSSLCLSSLWSLFAFRTLLFVLRSSLSSIFALHSALLHRSKGKEKKERKTLDFVFCFLSFFLQKRKRKKIFFQTFLISLPPGSRSHASLFLPLSLFLSLLSLSVFFLPPRNGNKKEIRRNAR